MYRKKFRRYRKKKGRGFWGKARTVLSTAKAALRTARYVKSLINVEFKELDTTFAATSSLAGDVTYLSNITQGDTAQSRDGDSVKLKSISVRGTVEGVSTATNFVRIVLVMDSSPTGALINPLNVYQTFSGEKTLSFRELAFTNRMTVLWDKWIRLAPTGSDDGSDIVGFKKHIKVDKHLKYAAGGGGIADATENALFVMVFSNLGANNPAIDAQCRIRYVDN